jgi:hypothetical protein
MFVRENQRVYFSGQTSSSLFTDEYPYPVLFAVLCALAPWRDAKSLCFQSKLRFDTPKGNSISY